MRRITAIVIHCAYTPPAMDVGVAEIRDWHVNGNGWRDIGYHWVIRRSGEVEAGRPEDQPGAHVAGHNANTIGICLVGGKAERGGPECNFTAAQWEALAHLVGDLRKQYPEAAVAGHNDFAKDRACPTFNVTAWAG